MTWGLIFLSIPAVRIVSFTICQKRSLVMGLYEDQIVYSIRFSKSDLDAGVVAATIAKGYGAGGGHDMMAGGRIVLQESNRQHADEIQGILVDRFLKKVGAVRFKPGELLLKEEIQEEEN